MFMIIRLTKYGNCDDSNNYEHCVDYNYNDYDDYANNKIWSLW